MDKQYNYRNQKSIADQIFSRPMSRFRAWVLYHALPDWCFHSIVILRPKKQAINLSAGYIPEGAGIDEINKEVWPV